jgi:hypothetical protein
MSDDSFEWQERWVTLAHNWQQRADQAGLGGVSRAMMEALQPLAPLAAQLLWVAQPTFSLFGRGAAIGVLAEMLEGPAGGADWFENQERQRPLQNDEEG